MGEQIKELQDELFVAHKNQGTVLNTDNAFEMSKENKNVETPVRKSRLSDMGSPSDEYAQMILNLVRENNVCRKDLFFNFFFHLYKRRKKRFN